MSIAKTHTNAGLLFGRPASTVLEIGLTVPLAGRPKDAVLKVLEARLRPHMGSASFRTPAFDGLLEDWGQSTHAAGSGVLEAWFYMSFDRLMSDRTARTIGDGLLARLELPELAGVQLLEAKAKVVTDLSGLSLLEARKAVAQQIYEAHTVDGGGYAEPASRDWEMTEAGDRGRWDTLVRDVTIPGKPGPLLGFVVPGKDMDGEFVVEFQHFTTAVSAIRLTGPKGEVEFSNAYHGAGFPLKVDGIEVAETSWQDMLQRLYIMACRVRDPDTHQREALDALIELGGTYSHIIDSDYAGLTALEFQIDSSNMTRFQPASELGDHLRIVVEMAESQLEGAGQLETLAPTVVANMWAAYGARIDAGLRERLEAERQADARLEEFEPA